MRLLTFRRAAGDHLGALLPDGETVVDLAAARSPLLTDMLAFLRGGNEARTEAERDVLGERGPLLRLDDLTLLAPVPVPESIRDCFVFERHMVQTARTVAGWRLRPLRRLDRAVERVRGRALIGPTKVWYDQPVYYKSNRFSVVGPEAEVRMPKYTTKFDYELELGIFIGKQGGDIPPERAFEHIGGFTIFNDFSARDAQVVEMGGRLGPAKGKDFDTGNSLGPYLVTPDELGDPYGLTMIARVNGEEWSRGTTGDMHHRWETIIAHLSKDETLYPGEFIGSGTVGNGCGLEFDRYLNAGDVVELEVEGLGILRNRVAAPH